MSRLAALRAWLDQFEIMWLGPPGVLWDFHRPDYKSCLAWRVYAGWWMVRKYKGPSSEKTR